jgi:transposase
MNSAQARIATREELIAENDRLEALLAERNHHLDWLERQIFGSKSERFVPNDQQTSLDLGIAPSSASTPVKKTVSYERTVVKKGEEGHGRGPMPSNLQVVDEIIEPEEKPEGCVCIGEETSWRYEYQRGKLYVKRTIRRKYALPEKEGVVIAELPPSPVEKGNAGPSLIAQVMQAKYEFHLPLDRQRKMIEQESGILLAESFMCDIIKRGCFWLEPIYNGMVDYIQKCRYLQADETPIEVLCKDRRGKTHRGYYWVYYDPLGKVIVFDYRKSRSREGPNAFLANFKGTVQVDGYEGYNDLIARPGIIRAACMDHVRRYFEKSLPCQRTEAEYALTVIGGWYAIERESSEQGLDVTQRLQRRRDMIAPAMDQFHEWLKAQVVSALPKSPLGIAAAYALGQWNGFKAFLNDGIIHLSNCLIENSIRPVAIGRKNYMFKGSHEAAQRGAMIYALIGTAKLHGINRFEYLTDLFTRLPAATNRQIESFLPQNWKPEEKNTSEKIC